MLARIASSRAPASRIAGDFEAIRRTWTDVPAGGAALSLSRVAEQPRNRGNLPLSTKHPRFDGMPIDSPAYRQSQRVIARFRLEFVSERGKKKKRDSRSLRSLDRIKRGSPSTTIQIIPSPRRIVMAPLSNPEACKSPTITRHRQPRFKKLNSPVNGRENGKNSKRNRRTRQSVNAVQKARARATKKRRGTL